MRNSVLLTLAGALLATGGVAFAQSGVATDVPAARAERPLVRDGGGPVDPAAWRKAIFERLDTNHDGTISFAEFEAARAQRGARFRGQGGPRGEGAAQGGEGRPHVAWARSGQSGRGFAAGRDRVITRDEFVAAMARRFDRLDANHDGKITPDERRAAFGARGFGRGPAAAG